MLSASILEMGRSVADQAFEEIEKILGQLRIGRVTSRLILMSVDERQGREDVPVRVG